MNDQNNTERGLSTSLAGNASVSTWLSPSSFEKAMQIAELMAKCGTLPAHLQGKPSDCFRIVVQAAKWSMDPFVVGECTSMVHGRLCFEGKLVAAVLATTGAIEGTLDYEISGEGQDAKIVVTGTLRGGKVCALKGNVKDWRTVTFKKDDTGRSTPIPNAWDKMPEDMLIYRGTRQWSRRYAPQAMMGISTPDEYDDVRDAQDVTVRDGDEGVPQPKAPKKRGAKEAPPAAADGDVAVPPAGAAPAANAAPLTPEAIARNQADNVKRATLIAEAQKVFDHNATGAAEVRAIANQLGGPFGKMPADKLDDALTKVRAAAKLLGVGAPPPQQQTLGGAT